MKKSLLCLLLCISLLLPTLVACGGTEPPAGEGGDQRPATPTDSPAALLAQKSAVIPCETDLELEDGGLLASSCVFDGYLYYAILALQTPEECMAFFEDLCTVSELRSMEQRYEVARLLNEGLIYNDILEKTGASSATISRVGRIFTNGTGTFKELIDRSKED